MTSAWLVRSPVSALFLFAAACHDTPQAPTNVTDPSPFETLTLDRITGADYDVSSGFGGLDILVPGDGSVHIVSSDYWDDRLRYAGCPGACTDAANWQTVSIDTALYTGQSGAVLTSDGISAVAGFFGGSGGNITSIRFAQCASTCSASNHWQTATILTDAWTGASVTPHTRPLAADSSGGLHLAFVDVSAAHPSMDYAYCAGSCLTPANWHTVVVDTVVGLGLAFQIQTDGARIHLLYGHPDATLDYATCTVSCTDAANWSRVVVDTASRWSLHGVSLALTPAGGLRVAYLATDSLRFAACDTGCTGATAWTSQSLGRTSDDVSLVRGADGVLHLATNQVGLSLGSCASGCGAAGAWTLTTVPAAGHGFVSLALDKDGRIQLASVFDSLQYTTAK